MRARKILTVAVIGTLAVTTAWAQMGDDAGWGDERPERKGYRGRGGGFGGGRFGKEGEGRGQGRRPGMGGPGGDRQPPMEMIIAKLLQNPEAREKLGLTEEQANAIKTGSEEIRNQMQELSEKMRTAAEEQVQLLQADTIDEEAVMAAVEKTGDIRTQIAKLRVQGMILVKSILTVEQIAKTREFMRNRMRERMRDRGPRDGDREGEGEGRRPRGFRGKGRNGAGREGDGIRGGWRDRERKRDAETKDDAATEEL